MCLKWSSLALYVVKRGLQEATAQARALVAKVGLPLVVRRVREMASYLTTQKTTQELRWTPCLATWVALLRLVTTWRTATAHTISSTGWTGN